MGKKLNTQEFIKKSIELHGDKYDYCKVKYINNKTKIEIICKVHGSFNQTPNNHLLKNGCKKCYYESTKSKDFIKKANIIHNNEYDYSKIKYINNKIKVEIICEIHGSYFQTPNSHLKKSGCPLCYGKFKSTKEEFIKKANKIHNNKYNYEKVNYINYHTKIEIICKEHGSFYQSPKNHLENKGCNKCFGKVKKTIEEFIKSANKIHNNKYNYDKVNYINNKTKIEIICKTHNSFFQTPDNHLKKNGCPKCYIDSKKMNTKEFIEKANIIHKNKYNYDKVNYINSNAKVEIICEIHGSYFQTPHSHLGNRGCPSCSHCVSRSEIQWLDYLNIPKEFRQIKLKINNKIIKADAVDLNNKIVYEFFGDYWHGNLQKYNPNEINKVCKNTFKYLHDKTVEKIKILEEAGFKVIYIWESDWKKLLLSSKQPKSTNKS